MRGVVTGGTGFIGANLCRYLLAEPSVDEVVVVDPRGGSAHLPLARCRPLGWLVPRSLRWHVREIPLVVVWSLLFQGLPEALRAARDTGGWVEIVPGE
jgi:nucleoside-diphosphate-sugar epimerase